jgi:hypothetical protein
MVVTERHGQNGASYRDFQALFESKRKVMDGTVAHYERRQVAHLFVLKGYSDQNRLDSHRCALQHCSISLSITRPALNYHPNSGPFQHESLDRNTATTQQPPEIRQLAVIWALPFS